jgi:hypothetical protein
MGLAGRQALGQLDAEATQLGYAADDAALLGYGKGLCLIFRSGGETHLIGFTLGHHTVGDIDAAH